MFTYKNVLNQLKEENNQVVTDYEEKVEGLTGKLEEEKFYHEYLSNIQSYMHYRVPFNFESQFDWALLAQLASASLSANTWLELESKKDRKPELYIEVNAKGRKVVRKISELWQFQISNLFTIFIKEWIELTIVAEEHLEEKKEIKQELIKNKEYWINNILKINTIKKIYNVIE
ncbi:hypothetical protein [Halanaerobacter jeridensis]|uniref:Uncharacterized protein n=1 Tax=Halanaerobacter jeridensis TaxID=706427 RepID=A0A939BQ72_9FIRM|nr:hypothetical protein [Halanaerobacter jeridensis]MBM7557783.1 hypothetical protein [Halanaerobacter jeridensis]